MKTVTVEGRVFLLLDDEEAKGKARAVIVGDRVFILLDDEETECNKVTMIDRRAK